MTDQWAAWRNALAGGRLDFGPKGQPPSGFYRHLTKRGIEAVAIWRTVDGEIKCRRSIFGDGSKMTADEIDELLASCGHYPISHELYLAVTKEGKDWPDEYQTRLTMSEIRDGVAWTPELGRSKLGYAVPENPRAVFGDNKPPEDLSADQQLSGQITALESIVKNWLKEIGGEPRSKAEADQMANFATKFAECKTAAESRHKTEKEPHLAAGRAVDALWFPIRDKAGALRKRCLDICNKWIDAEKARREEDARKANEEARRIAEERARHTDEPAQPVQEVVAEAVKIGNARTVSQRTRTVWKVTDLPAFAAYVAAMSSPPPDFIEACDKIANKLGSAGVAATGIEKTTVRSAA